MAYSDLNSTAKVRFLAGSQENIASYISHGDAIEGAFYLTNDTHRLYVGRQVSGSTDVIPVPVNEGINFVDDVASLPTPLTSAEKVDTAGHFYYASSENVLCVYNGKNWVQINPDTNDDHAVYGTAIAFTPLTSTDTGYSSEALTYNVNIPLNKVDLKNTGNEPDPLSVSTVGTLTIPKSAINELAGVAVNLAATYSSSNNTISLKASGSGYDTAATPVVLSAGNNISFANEDNVFTIAAPSYFMGVDASNDKIGLVSNTGDTVSTGITFAAGSELNVATTASTGTVTFSHATKSGLPNGTKGSINGKTIYVPSVGVNDYGHVTSLSETSITLREVTGISASGSTITLTYNNNTGDTLSVEIPEFSNYYTSSQVDQEIANKLQALNGLTYIGTTDSVPTGSIAIGDMYLLTSDISVPNSSGNQVACKIGDLIIANTSATDPKETNGYITGSLYWDRIQVDYNTDTTYSFTAASNNKLIVNDSALNQTSFEFASPGSTIAIETVIPSSGKDYAFNFDINWGTF